MRGQPSLLPSVRKQWLGKPLLYGIGSLLVMPLRTLHGVWRVFGAGRFLCNMTSVSSSLQIELVSAPMRTQQMSCYFRLNVADICITLINVSASLLY